MPKAQDRSPLVIAATALEDELQAFADLATEARHEPLNTERSMSRATKVLSEAVHFHARIEEKLGALVAAIDAVRKVQQGSADALVHVAHDVERRAGSRDALLAGFAQLAARAGQLNTLAIELTARQKDGAAEAEVLDRLAAIEQHLEGIVTEGRTIVTSARDDDWPEIARQADALVQQMQAVKNKLSLAHRSIARQAPS